MANVRDFFFKNITDPKLLKGSVVATFISKNCCKDVKFDVQLNINAFYLW